MGRIVVGIDGSQSSLEALRWAVDEARLRGASLTLVHAWSAVPLAPVATAPYVSVGALPELERSVAESAERVLEEALSEVAADGVDVERRVVRGEAAVALLDAAEGADMIVVGSRGHGGFTGLLLGSVGHALAHHARCPVVIVRGSGAPAGD